METAQKQIFVPTVRANGKTGKSRLIHHLVHDVPSFPTGSAMILASNRIRPEALIA
jgi:hypothetical protein